MIVHGFVQETALSHVWMVGLAGDGFGATHAMIRHNLIWVVSRMQVQVEQYPAWGDVVEMDTWVTGSGKNGMRRDWLVRDYKTGQVLARATRQFCLPFLQFRIVFCLPMQRKYGDFSILLRVILCHAKCMIYSPYISITV
jgi:fatty acyl-ACP thioesterase B